MSRKKPKAVRQMASLWVTARVWCYKDSTAEELAYELQDVMPNDIVGYEVLKPGDVGIPPSRKPKRKGVRHG